MSSNEAQRRSNRDRENDAMQAGKKQKMSPADDLVCPITLELPWDPVTAEDGRVYERSAIERHISSRRRSGLLKSPMTNLKMGKKLLPAPHIKNLINTLIENEAIVGDLADKWKQIQEEKKEREQLIQRAKSGDARAMNDLSYRYFEGINGFTEDLEISLTWAKKAHELGEVFSTYLLGKMYLTGRGVQKSMVQGLMYLTMAADRGLRYPAFLLGIAFSGFCRDIPPVSGFFGDVPPDPAVAIYWLEKCISGDNHHPEEDFSNSDLLTAKTLLNIIKAHR